MGPGSDCNGTGDVLCVKRAHTFKHIVVATETDGFMWRECQTKLAMFNIWGDGPCVHTTVMILQNTTQPLRLCMQLKPYAPVNNSKARSDQTYMVYLSFEFVMCGVRCACAKKSVKWVGTQLAMQRFGSAKLSKLILMWFVLHNVWMYG